MVFIGYEEGTKGYRLLEPVSKTLHISRDVIFEEDQLGIGRIKLQIKTSLNILLLNTLLL
jgi:hypothetical protein